MNHQLKPNTYTICESTEQCKVLFEWAENNGLPVESSYMGSEYALCVNNDGTIMMLWKNVEDTEIPLSEFISRLKGEWEGKTVTLSCAEWDLLKKVINNYSAYHGLTYREGEDLLKLTEQLNNQ